MRRLIRTLVMIILGLVLVPALFAFAIGAGATVLALLTEPRIMGAILIVLGIVSIPGILIGIFAIKS